MFYTPKQERNGAVGGTAAANPAVPGPDATGAVKSGIGVAEKAAVVRLGETAALIDSPAGSGVDGHVIGSGGDMWDWEAGLAIGENPGEA